jgi:hypothetical protein
MVEGDREDLATAQREDASRELGFPGRIPIWGLKGRIRESWLCG